MRSHKHQGSIDAKQLCIDLALMICTSRRALKSPVNHHTPPDWGQLGMKSVNHCELPSTSKVIDEHICCSDDVACRQASELRRVITRSLIDKVPACLQIYAVRRACNSSHAEPHGILLEHWSVKVSAKRRTASEKALGHHFLVQAIRSNLAFSQLSAWLSGDKPEEIDVQFRVKLDGEDSPTTGQWGNRLTNEMEEHQFPECQISRHHVLSLCVRTSKRCPSLLSAACRLCYSNPMFVEEKTHGVTVQNQLRERLEAIQLLPQQAGKRELSFFDLEPKSPDQISMLSNSFEQEEAERERQASGPTTSKRQRTQSTKILFTDLTVDGALLMSPEKTDSTSFAARFLSGQHDVPDQVESKPESIDRPNFCLGSPPSSSIEQCNVVDCAESEEEKCRQSRPANKTSPLSRFVFKNYGLPLNSSPAPIKRNQNSFDYDASLNTIAGLKNALYREHVDESSSDSECSAPQHTCRSAPASTNLLGNFEESALTGRMQPFGSVVGFHLDLAASGAFCPPHVRLPVTTFFFNVAEDNAPSPYLGHCSLESLPKRGYYLPKKGTVQATLFNPAGTVVKMFVVRYDLADMPPMSQTFVRQRTFFMPQNAAVEDARAHKSWLRYLIHLRFVTSRSSKLYLHTDIRMLFSRKCEMETAANLCEEIAQSSKMNSNSQVQHFSAYELRSFNEMPKEPKYSPKRQRSKSRQSVKNITGAMNVHSSNMNL